mmetsp:Transcript_1600/g.3395  ORF Transcript_1600/g.3395 Transcript_1600/m.3395 type:complete len:194 (+) Transcript_1600:75-656(+)
MSGPGRGLKRKGPSGSGGGGTAISIGSSRKKVRGGTRPSAVKSSGTTASQEELDKIRSDFLAMFSQPQTIASGGIPNSTLRSRLGDDKYRKLVPIINELLSQNRLEMSTRVDSSRGFGEKSEEMVYTLVNQETASKFASLDLDHKMVYQVIEKGGNMGLWVKDIRIRTGIQMQVRQFRTQVCWDIVRIHKCFP